MLCIYFISVSDNRVHCSVLYNSGSQIKRSHKNATPSRRFRTFITHSVSAADSDL